MSCTNPLKAFKIGHTEKGADKYKITSYRARYIKLNPYSDPNSCASWSIVYTGEPDERCLVSGTQISEFVEIPCGKCLGCRLDYAKSWSDRCMLENTLHDSSYFLTLTYDDEHLEYVSYENILTGEVGQSVTLVKKDLSAFIKRLRARLGYPIRFFGCGEYGDHSARPHYHVIVYGLKLEDLVEYKKTDLGDTLYTSEFLNDVWKKGFVVVGEVTPESCAYTARYCMKKSGNDKVKGAYYNYNIEPEFTLMSRRPGIARGYYDTHDMYKFDHFSIGTTSGSCKIYPSRYFDRLFDHDDPERMAELKARRLEYMKFKKELSDNLTSKDYLGSLKSKETVLESRAQALKRKEF